MKCINKVEIKYDLNWYKESILSKGLSKTWDIIFSFFNNGKIELFDKSFLDCNKLADIYEEGLAISNKNDKKQKGQYYTPRDVSSLMASFLLENSIENLADVACGCGNLVIEVLKLLLEKKDVDVIDFVKSKKVYLFDNDKLAIRITILRISLLLGFDCSKFVNVVCGDFLNKNVLLPPNATVISNPPFSVIKRLNDEWDKTPAFRMSKDLYIGFMEKIILNSDRAVIISPQSFLVGEKFENLDKRFQIQEAKFFLLIMSLEVFLMREKKVFLIQIPVTQ